MQIKAYAALHPSDTLHPFGYEVTELAEQEVEIKVLYCGLCHSDISMIENQWQQTQYPFVAGHEIVGEISKIGALVKHLKIGQKVGLGWQSKNCEVCQPCIAGKNNLCRNAEATIIGRHGGFASHVRANWQWVIPLPDQINLSTAGPLLCGGLTVFTPLIQHAIQGIHHVGVIGIGGLGHIAIQLYKAWGCKVTAFSSSPSKFDEILSFGANQVFDSKNIQTYDGSSFDLIVDTINVPLAWEHYINLLSAEGKFHLLGMVQEPIQLSSFTLIDKQASVSGSPTGSPLSMYQLLDFCARHKIQPMIEEFKISDINLAIQKLKVGELRYRAVMNMQELHHVMDQ